MYFPKNDIIEGITTIVNKHFNKDGVTFIPHLKKSQGFCALVPKPITALELSGILTPIRNRYKNIYVWVDSKLHDGKEIFILKFFQKHY